MPAQTPATFPSVRERVRRRIVIRPPVLFDGRWSEGVSRQPRPYRPRSSAREMDDNRHASAPVVSMGNNGPRWRQLSEALRESERRYRELVEYSLGLICTHDLSGIILSINPAAAQALGYQPQDGIGRNLRDFLSPDKRDLFDGYLRRIREQG